MRNAARCLLFGLFARVRESPLVVAAGWRCWRERAKPPGMFVFGSGRDQTGTGGRLGAVCEPQLGGLPGSECSETSWFQSLSHLLHLLVVVMSKVQFIFGSRWFCLPWIEVIWICERIYIYWVWARVAPVRPSIHPGFLPGRMQPNTSALRQISPLVPFWYQVCGLIRM